MGLRKAYGRWTPAQDNGAYLDVGDDSAINRRSKALNGDSELFGSLWSVFNFDLCSDASICPSKNIVCFTSKINTTQYTYGMPLHNNCL